MAKYVKELELNKPESFVTFIMEDYLKKNNFQMSTWKKESVYRTGDWMMEGYKYLNWSYINGVLRVEAWMKGTFGGEMGLTGFVGAVQKAPYRKGLEQLFEVLQQELPDGGADGALASQAIPVRTVDDTGAATMALILGIVSIPASLFIPLVGLICACVGYSRGRMGSGSSNAGMAKAGKVLSIIGALVAAGMYVLNIFLSTATMF